MTEFTFLQQIMINLCECILQSRVDVQKEQIKHFSSFLEQFRPYKEGVVKVDLLVLLSNLLKTEKSKTRETLKKTSDHLTSIVEFYFEYHGSRFYVQSWLIELNLRHHDTEHSQDTIALTVIIFEQILHFLTSQPLYFEFIKDCKLKQNYKINFNMIFQNQTQNENLKTIIALPKVIHKRRKCPSYMFSLTYSSIKSIYDLDFIKIKAPKPNNKDKKGKTKIFQVQKFLTFKGVDNIEGGDEFINLQLNQRKHSLYQLYDPDFQCTLLSNSSSSFSSSPRSSIKQIKFFPKELGIEQEEFQLLKISQDQQFLSENKRLFRQMSQMELLHRQKYVSIKH